MLHAFQRSIKYDVRLCFRVPVPVFLASAVSIDKSRSSNLIDRGVIFKMFQFGRVQGRQKFKPHEYMQYFEDENFRLTQKSAQMGRFEIGSVDSEYGQ
jgi:hypothetical protein